MARFVRPGHGSIRGVLRGKADGIIVTGNETGKPPEIDAIKSAKAAVGDVSVFVGSGTSIGNVREFLEYADGVIVGTSIKKEGATENPVDRAKLESFIRYAKS